MSYKITRTEENEFSVVMITKEVMMDQLIDIVHYDLCLNENALFMFFKHWDLPTKDLWQAIENMDVQGFNVAEFSQDGKLLFCDNVEIAA